MKYMLLIYGAENCWTEEERRECMLDSMAICDELAAKGKWIASAPLHSVTTATCVRVRQGHVQVTDGPFAETTEQLGGYYIIEVDDLKEAIAIASRLPPASKGTVEIRPLLEIPEPLVLPTPTVKEQSTDTTDAAVIQREYLVLLYAEPGAWPPEEHAAALAESVELCHRLHEQQQYLAAAPLQAPETATCVSMRRGKVCVTDGPFTETKEQLGGYFLVRVANLDEAIAIAGSIPGARRGTAEIRPLFPLPNPTCERRTAASQPDV